MFVPHTGGKRKSVLLTRERFHVMLLLSVFCVIVLLRLAYGYWQRQSAMSDLQTEKYLNTSMQQQVAAQQATIQNLNVQIQELNDQLNDLVQLEVRVRELAGLSKDLAPNESEGVAVGGQGGPDRPYVGLASDMLRSGNVYDNGSSISGMSDLIESCETRLTELADFLETKYEKMRCTPCIRPAIDNEAWLSSSFGWRKNPFSGKRQFHRGVDLAGPLDSPVVATGKGRVVTVKKDAELGWMVEIDHGFGLRTRYGHADKVLVDVGDRVERGEIIALLGNTGRSTGPHVHYEVLLNGKAQNPIKYFLD